MNKVAYILLGAGALVIAGGAFLVFSQQENPPVSEVQKPQEQGHMVNYTDAGYAPQEVRIKQGETVTFKNASTHGMWTASAMHPTHKAYPGTDIAKCSGGMMQMMFDACKDAQPQEEWMFQFNEKGTWGYHNHSMASHFGKVIVE